MCVGGGGRGERWQIMFLTHMNLCAKQTKIPRNSPFPPTSELPCNPGHELVVEVAGGDSVTVSEAGDGTEPEPGGQCGETTAEVGKSGC